MNKKTYKVNKEDNLKWTEKSDLQVVKDIIERADTKNLKELAKLYYCVKNGKFSINSNRTRVALCLYLADAIGERIMNRKRSPIKATIGILCIVTAVLLAVSIYFSNGHMKQLEETTKELHRMHHVVDEDIDSDTVDALETECKSSEDLSINGENVESGKQMLPELVELYGVNQDLFGWICIEGTEIDYPLVQASDNKYYLSHNFYKDEDSAGTLFVDYRNTGVSDTNLIVYGHNMRNSKMFGKLKNYEDYGFYQQHQTISLETLYEKNTYRIIAVCKGRVAYVDEEGFRYYNFTNASTQEELQAFWENLMEHSLFEITHEFNEADTYLTLSTCNSFIENGRLYVVAVKEN